MDNASYNTLEVKQVCETKLKIAFDCTKECKGWYVFNGKKSCRITIPKGRKFIPEGTYGSMAKQLKLKIKEFDEMLECTLSKAAYDNLLEQRVD